MKHFTVLLFSLAILFPSIASSMGSTFKTSRASLVNVREVWLGNLHVSAESDCTDDDYLDSSEISHKSDASGEKITYNGSGCASDPASPTTNHWVLAAGWYRVTMRSTMLDDTTTVDCKPSLYTGATGMATFLSNGNQGYTTSLIQSSGSFNIVPWTNACTGADADIQMNVMIERLDI